jgi:hypothetical protein
MDVIHLNHAQVLSPTANKRPEDIDIAPTTSNTLLEQQTPHSPSVIVAISEEGMELQVQEALRSAKTISYIEKSDAEYKAMSYRQLIDERNGEAARGRQEGDTSLKILHLYGKADHYALVKLREQQVANSENSRNIASALNSFNEKVSKTYPSIGSNFDITMKDGKARVVGIADKNIQFKVQSLLDDNSNKQAITLKNSINAFNQDGLEMINMMIYEERIKFGGTNEEGKKVIHRTNDLTMNEFLKDISYSRAASSQGETTWQKHQEVIGSTHYGVRYLYE